MLAVEGNAPLMFAHIGVLKGVARREARRRRPERRRKAGKKYEIVR
jgi:hypothetical protein